MCEDCFSGVNDTDCSLVTDHLVTDFVNYIRLYQRFLFLLNQFILCSFQFFLVCGIHGMSIQFQCNHEQVTHGILHQNIILIFFIPKNGPAVHGFSYHGLVVQNAHGTPAVGNGIFVFGVKAFGLLIILRTDIFLCIGHVVKVQFRKKSFLNHLVNHVIGRADHIIFGCTCLHLGKHCLVGVEFIVDYSDAGFLLKHADGFGVNIFAPVVNIHHTVFPGFLSAAAGERLHGKNHA